MEWIILLSIIIIGYLIIRAINNNSRNNAKIALYEHQNSPHSKKEMQINRDYDTYSDLIISTKTLILQEKIDLIDLPEFIIVPEMNKSETEEWSTLLTTNKDILQESKDLINKDKPRTGGFTKVRFVTSKEIAEHIKERIKNLEAELSEYEAKLVQFTEEARNGGFTISYGIDRDSVQIRLYHETLERLKQVEQSGRDFAKHKDDIDDDTKFEEAVKFVIDRGEASTSILQRYMFLSYGKASQYIDLMEHHGIVGPPDGSKTRKVLVSRFDKTRHKFK